MVALEQTWRCGMAPHKDSGEDALLEVSALLSLIANMADANADEP
jgi:hypothetical protein